MGSARWHHSAWVILAAVVVFPPLGLLLLWLRPQTRLVWKTALSVPVLMVGIAELFAFYGLRMEMAGGGLPGFVGFESPQERMEELERQRAAQDRQENLGESEATRAEEAGLVAASEKVPAAARAERIVESERSGTREEPYWTDFRGPRRDGHYTQMAIRTDWPEGGLTPLWRQPVGGGYASFVIAEGRAFTIEQRREKEVVAAYDLETGRELWTHSWNAFFQESMGGDGPRATPTWNEGRLYALGATGEFRCLDAATGKLIWGLNILSDNHASNITWGMAASPLVVDDKVIVQPGGRSEASVVAYDKVTGKPIWKSQKDRQSYTSPMLVTLAGQRQLLVVSAENIMGLTVEDGRLLWKHPWVTEYEINSAQPIVVDENHVFLSAGYGHGSVLLNITRRGDGFEARPVWENIRMKNRFNSSVLYEGYIYGFDESIFACIEAMTGDRCWKGGRYGYGQVVLASGHLIVLTERGDLVLVRPTPERLDEVVRFRAIEGKTWNHPALADGYLLVRNTREMAAFRVK